MSKYILLAIISFSAGVAISAGVFAFIVILGIVPRLAQKTKTQEYIHLYEDCITIGGILGTLTMAIDFRLYIASIGNIISGFFSGIFVGCLAVSLAEVIDVIPILARRANLRVGMGCFLLTLALGKSIGTIIYFLIPGIVELRQRVP